MPTFLCLCLLCFPAPAISPHRLSLSQVIQQADWVAVAEVLSTQATSSSRGSGLKFRLRVERALSGIPPAEPGPLLYWESWPHSTPGGKSRAPVWTGSGQERKVKPGHHALFLAAGSQLLRIEPLEQEAEIRLLLHPR